MPITATFRALLRDHPSQPHRVIPIHGKTERGAKLDIAPAVDGVMIGGTVVLEMRDPGTMDGWRPVSVLTVRPGRNRWRKA